VDRAPQVTRTAAACATRPATMAAELFGRLPWPLSRSSSVSTPPAASGDLAERKPTSRYGPPQCEACLPIMANPTFVHAPADEGHSFPWAPLSQSDDEEDDGGDSVASAQAEDGEEVEEDEEDEGADDDEDGLSVGVEEVMPLASDESGAEDDGEYEEEEEDDDEGVDDWAEAEEAKDDSNEDEEEDDYTANAAARQPPAQRRGVRGKSVPAHAKRSKGTLAAKAAAKAAKQPMAPERRPPARRNGAGYSSLAQLPPVPPGSGLLQDAINGVAVPPKVTEDTLIAVYTSESSLRSCWVQPLPPAGEAATAMALQRAATLSIPTALSRQLQVETPSFRVVQETLRPAVRFA